MNDLAFDGLRCCFIRLTLRKGVNVRCHWKTSSFDLSYLAECVLGVEDKGDGTRITEKNSPRSIQDHRAILVTKRQVQIDGAMIGPGLECKVQVCEPCPKWAGNMSEAPISKMKLQNCEEESKE